MLTYATQIPPAWRARSWRIVAALLGIVCAVIALSAPSRATAHPGSAHAGLSREAAGTHDIALRDCWMTAAFAPRADDVIQTVAPTPLDLSQTFYGTDALAGIWGISCDRANAQRTRFDRLVISLVAIPVALTSEGALPLANNFGHSLLRIDTNSRAFARLLRGEGLPARFAKGARLRHSSAAQVPSSGDLRVPGKYRVAVSAAALDPTNPHDHANEFSYVDRDGRLAELGLVAQDAVDRFCFPAQGGCSVWMRAHSKSPVRVLIGDGSAPVTVGFDHARISRMELLVGD
jgi:hypothetical protein